MPIIPQQGIPLVRRYEQVAASSDEARAARGAAMLRLLPGLEELCAPLQVWGLMSHVDLCLLTTDDWRAPWRVFIASHEGSYEVRYAMSETERPWPDAIACGTAEDVSQAIDMIRVAIDRSGGWR
jgi:hypothetical protein